jgi:Flp pilus assembly protein TadG
MTRPPQLNNTSGGARLRGDRGAATSLAVALLTPMFVFLAFAAFQAALWSHARTEARVIARDTAALIARSGVSADDAQASAAAILGADTDLRNVVVEVNSSNGVVTVMVTADAPGIIRGTVNSLSVTSAVPLEEITP